MAVLGSISGKPWFGYAFAGVAAGFSIVLRQLMMSVLPIAVPYVLYFPMVMLVAAMAGRGPGLLASLLGALAVNVWIVPPAGGLKLHQVDEAISFALSVMVGVFISLVTGQLQANQMALAEQVNNAREAEADLREANRQLNHVLGSITEGYILLGPEGTVLSLNAAGERMLEYRSEQMIGQSMWTFCPHIPQPFRDACDQVLRTREPVHYEGFHPGLEMWIEAHIHAVPEGLAIYFRDITERKNAEQEVHKSEQQFREAFASAPIGMVITDPQGRFVHVNEAYCRIVGYGAQELLDPQMDFQKLTHPEDLVHNLEVWNSARSGSSPSFFLEKRYFRKDGQVVWVRVSSSARRNASGEMIELVSLVEDITARKQTEAELQQAKLTAEQANAAKDHFLAVLSHELRTPLTPVLPALASLQQCVSAAGAEDLEIARRNIELEKQLIDDLLDVTRITRGKVELDLQTVDLCQILERAVEVCQPDLEARDLHFGVQSNSGRLAVRADPARLQQVFWNLLKNAIKFTPHAGCIGVSVWREDSTAVVEVSDSGVGIESEALDRIFNAFEQADRNVTRTFGGLGLGLAISKAMVEMHGGKINVRSDGRGRGATFRVNLPLTDALLVPPAPEAEPSPAQAQAAERKLRILLVEDHGDTARIFARLLRSQGHQVFQAGDVATALDLVHRAELDLIISDLGLPDRSGLDLMREVKALRPTLPGLAVSGYGRDEDVRNSRAAGFADHLTKPISIQRLRVAIVQAVGAVHA